MSLIGTLEQFKLASILQRIEAYAKTGLLTIKQGVQWVELYFREGRLICIGPLRATPTLGDRLVQDGIISAHTLQDTLRSLGTTQPSETRLALALMDMGHVSREDLRAWAAQKATEVLQIIQIWSSGEVHFEEEVAPPPDRLLVGLSVKTLLDSTARTTTVSPTSTTPAPRPVQNQQGTSAAAPSPDIARITTLMGTERFFPESTPHTSTPASPSETSAPAAPPAQPPAPEPSSATPAPASIRASSLVSFSPSSPLPATESLSSPLAAPREPAFSPSPSLTSLPATESLPPIFSIADEDDATSQPLAQPVPVMNPAPPRRIDISFMRPEMVLMPANLAAQRSHNPQVQITPQQWQVLRQVDGQTSLLAAAQALAIPPDLFCQVAGELIAAGLLQVVLPGQPPTDTTTPPPGAMTSGFNQGYIMPGYAAAAASPWAPAPPVPDVLPATASSQPPAAQPSWEYSLPGVSAPGFGPQPGRAQASYSNIYAQVGGGAR